MANVKEPNPEFADQIVKAGGKSLNLCYQCGTCTASCPSGRQTAFRTRKLIRKAQLGLKEDILPSDDLWMCTTCYTCVERCPRTVDITDIIIILRNFAVKEGYMADSHKKTASSMMNTGHTIPLTDDYKNLRKKLGLSEQPPTVLGNPKALEDWKKIMKATGFDKLIGGK